MPNTPSFSAAVMDGSPREVVSRAQVNSNIRTTCFSIDELEQIVLTCNCDMLDYSYTIKAPDGTVELEGTTTLPAGTQELKVAEILPLADMRRFERLDGPFHYLEIQIQAEVGNRLTGYAGFAGSIVAGTTSTVLPSKDLKERLAAIPIAKPGMSVAQLRKICLDYMNLQCEFPHKLSDDLDQFVVSQKKPRRLRKQIVHGGLPYITVGSGNLYRVAEFYDSETGTIDISGDMQVDRIFGNACSGGAGSSWARAITSATLGYTSHLTEKNGYIPVGPYRYSRPVKDFIRTRHDPNGYDCKTICQENGEQTMFESYAALQPADGVVNDGHVRMNSQLPIVVRLADGSIDPDNSFVFMSEQVCYTTNPNHVRVLPDGTHYIAQGGVNIRYSFRNMFETHYIPFTFAEFLGTHEVEEAWLKLSTERNDVSAEELCKASIRSNYPISDVFVTVKDSQGNEVYRYVHRALTYFCLDMALEEILPCDELAKFSGCQLDISCQLYNGEKLVAFNGTLTA